MAAVFLATALPPASRADTDRSLATEVTVGTLWDKPAFGRPFRLYRIGLEMMPIPAGAFAMGSPLDEPGRQGNEAQHAVRISRPFWMGRTDVTHRAWKIVMGTDLDAQVAKIYPGVTDPSAYEGKTDDDVAMYYVSWDEAMEFCRRLNASAEAAGAVPAGYAYSLPTEAQWEYACRAGTKDATYAGPIRILGNFDAPVLDAIAWYGGNSSVGYRGRGWDMEYVTQRQHPGGFAGPRDVGLKKPNAWGLYDMLGNVWQWCLDWYAPYPDAAGVLTDPAGPTDGTIHVHRGGSWYSYAASCRAASRSRNVPGDRFFNLGFRVVLAPIVQPSQYQQDD